MTNINDLNTIDALTDNDKLVVWNGSTRAITAADAADYFSGSGNVNLGQLLTSIQSLSPTIADQLIYTTGSDFVSVTPITPFSRSLLSSVSAATALTALNGQPLDATLTAVAGLTVGAGDYIEATGVDTFRARKLTVATYAALTVIAAASRFDDMLAYVASRATDGDGGEGWWRFDAASSATANGGTILAPDAGSGRWLRVCEARKFEARWFGITADGVTDNSTAIAAAFAAMVTAGGGTVIFPAGDIVWNSTVTVANVPMHVRGAPGGLTKIIKVTGTNLLTWSTTTFSGSETDQVVIEDLEFEAAGTGSRGHAISLTWPSTGMINAQTATLQRLVFRCAGSSGSAKSWQYPLLIANASNLIVDDIKSDAVGSAITEHIRLAYGNGATAFSLILKDLNLNGGLYGIYGTGWFENVNVSDFEIVGQSRCLFFDASTSSIPGGRNPVLLIGNGHLNGKEWGIFTDAWNAINLNSLDMYHGVGSGTDVNGGNVRIGNCKYLTITSCKFGSPVPAGITLERLLVLSTVEFFNVTGCWFWRSLTTQIEMNGMCKNGLIASCLFDAESSGATQAILLQNSTTPGASNYISMKNLQISGVSYGLNIIDCADVNVRDVDMYSIGILGILVSGGSSGDRLLFEDIRPAQGAKTINGATPSVSGAVNGDTLISNAGATTVTNLTGGVKGQSIKIYDSTGVTTIEHNANIALQGGADFAMATGNGLFLYLDDVNVWREVGRRT